ncbi:MULTISPECIES: hypothetical protein [Bacillus]|uniref:hypothetical protein n=1 Tax=Bacillus TaxID=1386 RepID=UPI000BEE3DEA|nr:MULTISPECIES: hypothetical protein [Bacillus]MEC2256271.1 hypothetical protein [Bacillus cereus]MED3312657.1 hypothetical protein [Bacillus thuringiensis]PEB72752.1 hypothetical protein COM89_26360 [Bacillus thuringiensis]PFN10835.1 hypothetical protein COJ51_03325 [Bacillus thuringiensis]PFT09155.1 hypothetical protein COK59_09645 [Bacillus thuringiensis]
MYIVEFLQKEQSKSFKKFLKKNKVSNGKQLGLLETENLIQRYIEQNQQSDQVLLLLQDFENEKAYEFELPIGKEEKFSLLTAISRDLENGTDFDLGMEIKQGIYASYKSEREKNSTESEKVEAKKKKGGLFTKLFSKKEKASAPNEKEKALSNYELEEDFEEQIKFSDMDPLQDFKEMSSEELDHSNANMFDSVDIEGLEREVITLEKEGDPFAIDEEFEKSSSEDMLADISTEDWLDHASEEAPIDDIEKEILYPELENSVVAKEEEANIILNTKEVIFPEYDSFVDLSEVKEKQERYHTRFSITHLLGLLGIDKEPPKTALEIRKLQYAKNVLSGKQFLLIQDGYYQDVNNLLDEIRLYLEQDYRTTMLRDYSTEAEIALRDTFEGNMQSLLDEYKNFESKEQYEIEGKLQALREKQELELEAFKIGQETKFKEYQLELEERKMNLVNAHEERLMEENEVVQKQKMEEKIHNLKLDAKKELIDKKNEALSHFANTIEDLMNMAFKEQQEELSRLQGEIENLIPIWAQEIEAERNSEHEKQRQEIERERLELEKQALHLQMRSQEGAEKKDKERIRELQNIIEDLTDKLQKSYNTGMGQHPQPQMYQQPVYMYQQPVYQQPMQPMQPQSAAQQPMMQQTPQPQQPVRKGILSWLLGSK